MAADTLAKLGSDREKVPSEIFVEELTEPSIKMKEDKQPETIREATTDQMEIDQTTETRPVLIIKKDWRQELIYYIKDKKLPEDKTERTRLI